MSGINRYLQLFALAFGSVCASHVSAQDLPNEFEIASDSIEGWSVKAMTEVRIDWTDEERSGSAMKVPFFAGARCEAQSGALGFGMDEKLNIEWMGLHFPQFRDADGTAIPSRVLELYLDEELFHLGYGQNLRSMLFGFHYPANYQLTPGFFGYSAYKRPGDAHWKPVARLFDRLMSAGSARLGQVPIVFGDEGDDQTIPKAGEADASFDLSGFQKAASWCEDTLRSPATVTLPDPVKKAG
ncbi:hypothetical protein A8B77_01400 [Erythrobacter sp. EhN03]|uniref:hypothetical protein n=1 Tax=Qipengyuania flava TaxID=192812 RepID=UPI0007F3AAE6|nr:hypothetical protein A8B77_01400 [Erythrobacter sp. EhN03]